MVFFLSTPKAVDITQALRYQMPMVALLQEMAFHQISSDWRVTCVHLYKQETSIDAARVIAQQGKNGLYSVRTQTRLDNTTGGGTESLHPFRMTIRISEHFHKENPSYKHTLEEASSLIRNFQMNHPEKLEINATGELYTLRKANYVMPKLTELCA